MRPAGELLLADARAALERRLDQRPQSDLALVFAYWMAPDSAPRSEVLNIAKEVTRRAGAQQDFQTVAAMGFAFDAGLLGAESALTLRNGLHRLAGRSAFVDGMPMPFCSDSIGILGVAVACRALSDSFVSKEISAWLAKFIGVIHESDGIENWQRAVFHAVDSLLGGSLAIPTTDTEDTSDVRAALVAKGLLSVGSSQEAQTLAFIARNGTEPISFERAVLRRTALSWLLRTAPVVVPGRVSVETLVRLLERVPAGLRKWTWETTPRTAANEPRQWHVDHEYHVQNLLWVLLSPIFPDLDDEQYLTKIGQKNPRADFYIPSLKIVVEVKFLRASDRIQKVIDEIAADLSLYRALGNDCAGVISFIWDDSARTNEHDYLRQGLKKMHGLVDAVVISRPSDWTTNVVPAQAKASKRAKQ